MKSNFAGTGTLIRLFLRRDRLLLPIWVLLPLLVTLSQVKFVMALPDWQNFIAELSANPLTSGFLGPVVPLSLAGAIIWRSAVQGAMAVAIGSFLTIIRHTCTEEETGRSELLRGGAVGRHAALAAALVLTCTANLAAGVLAALGLIGNGLPASGALLFGLTIAASGWFFAGVGAMSVQLREHTSGARGIALTMLGVAFLLYVLNNVGGGYTSWAWFTPMGWYRLTQPFAGNHWQTLLLLVILSAIPVAAAYILSDRRDLGGSMFQPRLGPAAATPGLGSPLALAWRLHKSSLMIWTAGMFCMGLPLGNIGPNISNSISDIMANIGSLDWLLRLGSREAFIAVLIYIISLMTGVTVYAIATVLRLRQEETENLAELLLAKPVSRIEWMSSHLVIAFTGSLILQLILGLAVGLGWGLTIDDMGGVLPRVLGMSLSKVPVIWTMAGLRQWCMVCCLGQLQF
jgi:ABC-2 type transport system permease protein